MNRIAQAIASGMNTSARDTRRNQLLHSKMVEA